MNVASRFLLLAGIAIIPTGLEAQAPSPEPRPEVRPVVVPFELLKSRHLAIEVKINGKGPYRLIFDTGAPTNLINNKLAREAGVLKKDDKSGIPLFGMAGPRTIDVLEVGGVKLEKVPVMVMDHPTVAAISKALGPIDGLVGFPFFARFKTTIDYQKRELTFVPNGYVPGDAMQGLTEKLMNAQKGKPEPAIVAPAALWGFGVDKPASDEEAGVNVQDVFAGSAAARGGLKIGDRLLTLDGRWTDSIADVFVAASLVKPGRTVTLVVKRDGKEVQVTVKPTRGA